ncbi:MAG TPA: TA system VapC family ribonuclease toxin [Thermoanaerobaculia bacterium]|nr:TA system VapC family ribonuclease toxin [Thermoanaerobaculia bacterium]
MILIDTNLLLYAKIPGYPQHPVARAWLEDQLNSRTRVGLPWQVLLSFLRLTTNPRMYARPFSTGMAWQQVVEWISHPRVWIPEPSGEYAVVLGKLLVETQATGNLVSDAHLAALAIEHGLTLCSADTDFARFSRLTWLNPLA